MSPVKPVSVAANLLRAACAICLLLFACKSPFASAQEGISYRQGAFEVFYSAFNTSFLKPEVARAAGITRAADRGLLNISLVRHEQDGSMSSIAAASIAGESYDLLHRRKLEFSEVVEPGAHYYLAPFKISNNNEMLQFTIEIQPPDGSDTLRFEFSKHFFHNP